MSKQTTLDQKTSLWLKNVSKERRVFMMAGLLLFVALAAYLTYSTYAYGIYGKNSLIFGHNDLTRFQNSTLVIESESNKRSQQVLELVNDNGFTGPNNEYPVGPGELIVTPLDEAKYRSWMTDAQGKLIRICVMARGISGNTAVEVGLLSTPSTGAQWDFVENVIPDITSDYNKYCGDSFNAPSVFDPRTNEYLRRVPYAEYQQIGSSLNGDTVRIGSIIIEKVATSSR